MNKLVEFGIRISVDGQSSVPDIERIGGAAKKMALEVTQAGQAMAQEFTAGAAAVKTSAVAVAGLAESETAATDRIRAMVAASLQQSSTLNDTARATDQATASMRRATDETNTYASAQERAAALARSTAAMTHAPVERVSTDESQKYIATLQRQFDQLGKNNAELAQFETKTLGGTRALQAKAGALVSETEALRAQIAAEERAGQAADNFIAKLKAQVDVLGMSRQQLLSHQAAQLGVSHEAAPMIARLTEAGDAAKKHGTSIDGATKATHEFGFATARSKTELLVLAHELTQGRYTNFGQSLMVLGEQTGAMSLLFSAAGLAIGAVVLAIGSVAVAAALGAAEQKHMNNALILTGTYAGVTADGLRDLADAAIASGGSIGAAKKAVIELAGTGRFTADQIGYISTAAVHLEHVAGISIEKTIKHFEALAVQSTSSTARATETISRAAIKLNDEFHFMTEAVYEHVRALEKQGDTYGAADLAMRTYADALSSRTHEIEGNQGSMIRGWHAVTAAAGGAWDAMLGIGKKATPATEVARLEALLSAKSGRSGAFVVQDDAWTGRGGAKMGMERTTMLAELAVAQTALNAANDKAKKDGETTITQAAGVHAASRLAAGDARHLKETKLELALAQNLEYEAGVRAANANSPLITDEAIAARKAKAIKDNTEKTTGAAKAANDAYRVAITEAQSLYKIDEITTKQHLDALSSAHKNSALGDIQFANASYAEDLMNLGRKKALLIEEEAIARSSTGKSPDAAKYRAALAQVDAEILARAGKLSDDLVTIQRGTDLDVAKAEIDSLKSRGQISEAYVLEFQQRNTGKMTRALLDSTVTGDLAVVNALLQEFADGVNKADFSQFKDASGAAFAELNGQISAVSEMAAQDGGWVAQFNAVGAAQDIRSQLLPSLQETIDKMRELAEASGNAADRKVVADLQKQIDKQASHAGDAWKPVMKTIDSTFHDAFAAMLAKGTGSWKSFTEGLRNTFKSTVADAIYQMFARPFVMQLVASGAAMLGIQGTSTAQGVAGSASAIGGAASLLQTASGAYNAITTGFAGIGQSVSTGVQTGIDAMYGTSGMMGPTAAGGNIAAGGSTATMAGTAASYAAGMAAGKMIGSTISGQYGIGDHGSAVVNVATIAGAVIGGPIGAAIGGAIGGLANRLFGMGSKDVVSAGVSGSLGASGFEGQTYSKWHQDGGFFRSDKDGVDPGVVDATMAAGFTDGYKALQTASSSFAKTLGIDASAIATRTQALDIVLTKDAAANEKAITDFFIGVGDAMAIELVPNLTQFAKTGELASATLQRIAGDYQAVDAVLATLSKDSVGAFGAVGIASVSMREQLVAAAGSVAALTSGTVYFAQNFLTAAEQIAPIAKNVTGQLAAMGLASVTTNDQFKNVVLGLDLSTKAGAEQYAAMLLLAPQFKQMTDYTTQLSNAAITAAKDGLQSAIDKTKTFAATLKTFAESNLTGALSVLTPLQKYAETQAQYARTLQQAQAGDATAQGVLTGVATAFLEASRVVNASDAQYSSDFARVQQQTADMALLAATQIDVGQASLNALTLQVSGLATLNDSTLSIAAAVNALTVAMGGKPALDGSHAGGLASVPFDGYRAELHQGKGVIDAPAMTAMRRYFGGSPSTGGGNTDALVAEIKRLNTQIELLRAEQKQQISDTIQANFDAHARTASTITAGAVQAARESVWAKESKEKERVK